jgi:hypothetical protein
LFDRAITAALLSCGYGSGVSIMSKSALSDAYAAGFQDGRASASSVRDDEAAAHCVLGFDGWWMQATETLDRAPICPDNSHDYRVDDSDGLLKCTTCGKVLF